MKVSHKTWLLMLGTFALYVFSRSLWLDEWDSVQFADGIREFNLWDHKPHPPGYPVYIFAGKLLAALGFDPVSALILVGCLAGAWMVAAWFLIVRREYNEPLAWLVAVTTALTPAVWMVATKALTDIPAAAGLATAVLFGLAFRHSRRTRDLVFCALACAATTGLRPQFLGITAVLLITVMIAARISGRHWAIGVLAFLLGQCAWLVPTAVSQARLNPEHVDVWAYRNQLLRQWKWRLDKPNVYIGASGFTREALLKRAKTHVGGWIRNGMGIQHSAERKLWRTLFWIGLVATLLRNRHGSFWRVQAPWMLLLVATVFCCLPEDRRYYVALTPMLWLAILPGLWSLPKGWRFSALLAPLLMLYVGLPLARAGHREPPPPVQMINYIETLHPAEERPQVWLLLADTRRHGDWYAREFQVSLPRSRSMDEQALQTARAIYTDAADFPTNKLYVGCTLETLATFQRNPAVYPKHSSITLYRVRRPGEVPTLGK